MEHAARTRHEVRTERLRRQYAAAPPGAPVRLAKSSSNLFRTRRRTGATRLDVGGLDGVLAVDPVERTADAQGMTTYERLVDATLAHGLMPLVVPQLKTITLGYALRLRIELEPVRPFVRLRHVQFGDRAACFEAMAEVCEARSYEGEAVDFVDGTVFDAGELYLTLGTFVDEGPAPSDYTGMGIYYRSLRRRRVDHLRMRDYLWRWDTDWFWCSRAFGVQDPRVRRLVPKRWLRSDSYWRLVAVERRYGPLRRLERLRGRPAWEHVVQDVEIPIERASEFFDFLVREVPILPFWLCPLRLRDPGAQWDLYPLGADLTYVNFGFWSTVPLAHGQPDGVHDRRIEQVVEALGGRKSLYSTSYYGRDEFWRLYNGPGYAALKDRYDGEHRLLDLYEKCVERG